MEVMICRLLYAHQEEIHRAAVAAVAAAGVVVAMQVHIPATPVLITPAVYRVEMIAATAQACLVTIPAATGPAQTHAAVAATRIATVDADIVTVLATLLSNVYMPTWSDTMPDALWKLHFT